MVPLLRWILDAQLAFHKCFVYDVSIYRLLIFIFSVIIVFLLYWDDYSFAATSS